MTTCIKYGLTLLVCLSVLHRASANEIDRLTTKADVRKFIEANFGEKGLFTGNCSPISQAEKGRMWFARYFSRIDTAGIRDPAVLEQERAKIADDVKWYSGFFGTRTANSGLEQVTKALDNTDWHFYKADIDHNGYTDVVIDAGMVIIIMDMGDSLEGQVVSLGGGFDLYGFKQFIPLPDGTFAIALRHDHNNPLKSKAHSNLHGRVTLVMDTLTINTRTHVIKMDTLYKITTGADSIWKYSRSGSEGRAERVYNGEYADTIDMRLYNMTDTIVYKYDGFTRYKREFGTNGITRIDYYYQNSGSLAGWVDANTCMEITRDGKCLLKYYEFDTTFSAVVEGPRLKKLWDFISCLDLGSRKEYNECIVTDGGEGATFAIYFDDGTVKKLDYWNYRMPIDLGYVGKAFADISNMLHWQRTEKNGHFECPCVLTPPVSMEDDSDCGW